MKLYDFVSLKSEQDGITFDDIGKLTYFSDEEIRVSYFDDPSQPPVDKTFKINDNFSTEEYFELILENKELTKQTRVYMYEKDTKTWRIGRMISQDSEKVECIFPNNLPPRDFYPNKDVFVRWNKPIKNPLSYLKSKITESKYLSDKRETYSKFMIQQRSTSIGISSIMSSLIDLEDYQIEIVSRVLKDPIQRYLLSDEVGLGKTIEAGIILKQFVNDSPQNHKTIIITPPTLVIQWERELEKRFFLSTEIEDKSIEIFSYDDYDKIKENIKSVKMVIIDEAHHLNRRTHDNLYSLIDENCRDLSRFLILSATPVYNNELNYFEMLHLLDPVVYPLANFERFKTLIANRQGLAENIAALDPMNVFDMRSELDTLRNFVQDDTAIVLINNLEQVLDQFPDEEDPDFNKSLFELKAFLSETYKLDRRILGTRREKAKSAINIERNGIKYIDFEMNGTSNLISKLDDFRISKNINVNVEDTKEHSIWKKFFNEILKQIQERDFSTDIFEKIKKNSEIQLEIEDNENINEISKMFENLSVDQTYFNALDDVIKTKDDAEKFILFCSSKNVAKNVYSYLMEKFPDKNPIRYEFVKDDNNKLNAFVKFQEDTSVKLIVCDKFSEEGINLQGHKRNIIHIDLPFNPNRIEQRIGRIDRFGNSSFNLYALRDLSNNYEKIWLEFLENTLEIFSNSTASLQILLEQKMAILFENFFDKGIDAFIELNSKMSGDNGLIKLEKKRINHQDQLNSMSFVKDERIETLISEDLRFYEIKKSIFDWLCNTLMIGTNDDTIKFIVSDKSKFSTVNEFLSNYKISKTEMIWSGVGKKTLDYMNDYIEKFNITSRFQGNQNNKILFEWLISKKIDVLVVSSSHSMKLNLQNCKFLQDGTVLGGETFRFEMETSSLIPLDLFFKSFKKTIDKEKSNLKKPRVFRSYEYTSRRQTALNDFNKGKHVRLLRLGDDFIEGLNSLFENDDRGKSYAIWRYNPKHIFHEPAELFFSLSYLIEGDIKKAKKFYRSMKQPSDINISTSLRRQIDGYFKPSWQKIWLNSNFESVKDDDLLKILNAPFNKKYDKNFTTNLWNNVKNLLTPLQNWENNLETAFDNGINLIKSSINYQNNIEDALKRFKVSNDLINAQNQARIQYIDKDRVEYERYKAVFDTQMNENIEKGISNPLISLNTVGVIFLSKIEMKDKFL